MITILKADLKSYIMIINMASLRSEIIFKYSQKSELT